MMRPAQERDSFSPVLATLAELRIKVVVFLAELATHHASKTALLAHLAPDLVTQVRPTQTMLIGLFP